MIWQQDFRKITSNTLIVKAKYYKAYKLMEINKSKSDFKNMS